MKVFERRTFLIVVAIAFVYLAAAKFGLLWAVGDSNASPLWPPAGIAVASVLVFGAKVWPGIFIGAFAANWTHHNDPGTLSAFAEIAGAIAIALGNTAEALLVSYLCSRRLQGRNPLEEVFNLIKFVPITMVASLASAFVGTLTTFAMGMYEWANLPLIFVVWWLGDTLAILVLAPFLISWIPFPRFEPNYRWSELVAVFAVLLILCEVIFGNHLPLSIIISRPVWLMPVLIWLALRFSKRELTTGVALISIVAAYATSQDRGPFIAKSLIESLLAEQLFCAMVAITTLIISASVTKNARYQRDLQFANEQLELRVAERTRELEKKARILEAINNQLRIEARERQAAENQLHRLLSKNS